MQNVMIVLLGHQPPPPPPPPPSDRNNARAVEFLYDNALYLLTPYLSLLMLLPENEQCWCGNGSTDYDTQGDSHKCTYECAGDAGQQCGGYDAMSVYAY